MARNTGPAPNAHRWPGQREAQPAQRPDHQTHARQPHAEPAYVPAQEGLHGQLPAGNPGAYDNFGTHDPYAGYGHGQPTAAQSYPAQPGGYSDPYAPPQAPQYSPQFEPYQPPQPQAGHAGQGWPPPQSQQAPQAGHWQQAEPPASRAQPGHPTHRGPNQQAGGYGYDAGEPQFAADPYGGQAMPSHAPQLRGASYDQSPDLASAQAQPGWGTAAPEAYAEVYGQEQAAWPPQQAFDPHGYPEQGYDQQGYEQPGYDQQPYEQQPFDQQGYAQPRYGQQDFDPQGRDPALGLAQLSSAYGFENAPGGYHQPGTADTAPYSADPGFGPADGGYAPPAARSDEAYAGGDYDPEEVAFEDDAPARGRSGIMKIAAAAAVALTVAGGGYYGYSAFMAPSGDGSPPVVRKADAPAKIKPDDPGGKKFAHTDSKILGRLSDQGARSDADSADSDGSGPRKVPTMVIGRDGSIVESSAAERPPPSALPAATSPVPGMTIVDGFGGRRPSVSGQPPASIPALVNGAPARSEAESAEPAAKPEAQAAPPPAAKPQPTKPVVITRAEPAVTESEPAAAPAPPVSEPKPTATRKTAARPAAEPAAAAPSGAGYVAVLASIPRSASSRIDALKQFADLQQRYAAQLGGKTPDVQEANLGEKGTYHRLIAGPPGSRDQASRLCSELKSAGYSSCWIKSY